MLIVVERRETFHYYYPMGVHPPGDLTVTSFQLTQDGAELVAAAAIDQYSKMGYVSEINEDLQTAQVILVGEEKINYEMYFDANNAELASALQHMSEVGDNAKAMFVFHYNADIKSLQIDKCENVVEETHVNLDASDEDQ